MSPEPNSENRSSDPRPRPNGDSGDRSGDRSRSRRRSGRGGRSRSGAAGGTPAPAGQTPPQGSGAPAATPAQGARPAQGGGRPQQGQGGQGGQNGQRPANQPGQGAGGEGRNRAQGGRRSADGNERGGGRPQQGQGGRPAAADGGRGQAQQQDAGRSKRREAEREGENIPNLTDWSFEHAGYVAWMAHAQILPTVSPQRAVRSYIVDIHVGEDAVNPRLWPAIVPFIKLEVVSGSAEAGARALAEAFRQLAATEALAPAAEYLKENPPSENPISSPVQAALDTALPLDLDHPQEDIEIMNEGRKGAPLPRRN